MQWICYIGGCYKSGKVAVIQIVSSGDPERYVASLTSTQPFDLKLMAIEKDEGNILAERRKQFRQSAMSNGWHRAVDDILQFVKSLPEIEREKVVTRKVCVDFSPDEAEKIQRQAIRHGAITKARLIRRAVKFYLGLLTYKERGWTVQVIKGGRFVAFSNLDNIEEPVD